MKIILPSQLDYDKYYKIIDIQTPEGISKVHTKLTYLLFINNTITRLRPSFLKDSSFCVRMNSVLNADGRWANYKLCTSLVSYIKEDDETLYIHTKNSIYVLKPAEKPTYTFLDKSDFIELYINNYGDHFCKGYYYDNNKTPYELDCYVNVGMFQDSCLIKIADDPFMENIVCRYFPKRNGIQFYDTLYHQQDYSTPILIHNTADEPIDISFEWSDEMIVIPEGESELIDLTLLNNDD